MNAILRITDIHVENSGHDYPIVRIVLENTGDTPVTRGQLIGWRLNMDGTAKDATLPCSFPLAPGEKAWLNVMLHGSVKGIDFIGYEPADGAIDIRVVGLRSWWSSPWSLRAA